MKCVCGHKSAKPFEQLCFNTMEEYPTSTYPQIQREGIYNDVEAPIFVCPKCGTLKIDIGSYNSIVGKKRS